MIGFQWHYSPNGATVLGRLNMDEPDPVLWAKEGNGIGYQRKEIDLGDIKLWPGLQVWSGFADFFRIVKVTAKTVTIPIDLAFDALKWTSVGKNLASQGFTGKFWVLDHEGGASYYTMAQHNPEELAKWKGTPEEYEKAYARAAGRVYAAWQENLEAALGFSILASNYGFVRATVTDANGWKTFDCGWGYSAVVAYPDQAGNLISSYPSPIQASKVLIINNIRACVGRGETVVWVPTPSAGEATTPGYSEVVRDIIIECQRIGVRYLMIWNPRDLFPEKPEDTLMIKTLLAAQRENRPRLRLAPMEMPSVSLADWK